MTTRPTSIIAVFLAVLLTSTLFAVTPAMAQFEIEYFERAVTQADGQPVFLTDLAAAAAVDPAGGVFDNGTSVSVCCGSFMTLNTIIGLSTDSNAITEGTQALSISMTNNNPGNGGGGNTAFDRPAILRITSTDPRYVDIEAVAANPANFKMVADLTLIADEVPDTFSTDGVSGSPFIQLGFFQNSAGFVEPPELRDAVAWSETELMDMEAAGFSTKTLEVPATLLGLPTTSPTAYQIGFVFNGNWQLTERAAFNIDNWRFEAAFVIDDLDIVDDDVLDALDFEALMSNHLDPAADTFGEGDVDGDGDNDFDDFRFFEDGWNAIGPSPFSTLLGGVPEPSSIVLLSFAAMGGILLRRRRGGIACLLVVCLCLVGANSAQAQLANTVLFDWEDGLQGWEVAGDNAFPPPNDPVVLGNSSIGSTQSGSQSFSITQPEGDIFSWNATNSIFGNDNFAAIDSAVDIGAEHFMLEMDVTYDSPGSLPAGAFANISLRMQSSAGSSEVGGLASYDFASSPQTISVSQSLDGFTALPLQAGETGFYRIDIGMNGDWGLDPGTLYFDNLRIRQVSEPALLTLEVNTSTGATGILNNSGADGTGVGGAGDSIDFNYYQVLSGNESGPEDTEPDGDVDGADFLELQRSNPGLIANWETAYGGAGGGPGSLNPSGWDPLDDETPGLQGWTASGGVDSALAESNFLGSETLADTLSLSLGNAFSSGGAENLSFFYREPGRPDLLLEGNIVYVGGANVSGAAAVPEASTDLLVLVALTVSGFYRNR